VDFICYQPIWYFHACVGLAGDANPMTHLNRERRESRNGAIREHDHFRGPAPPLVRAFVMPRPDLNPAGVEDMVQTDQVVPRIE
jgi:hypothetical protein